MLVNLKRASIVLACGLMSLLTACGSGGKLGDRVGEKNGASSSSLFLSGKITNSFLTFHGVSDELPSHPTAGRAIEATISLAVGGETKGVSGSSWRALAATFTTTEVSDKGNDSGGLFLDDAGNVSFAREGGDAQLIGSMKEVGPGNPIDLNDGVKADLLVDGEPFQLGKDSKSSSGKSLAFEIP